MKILALDDEEGALKVLSRAILSAQPEAELAGFNEIEEAIEYAKKENPDVAFLDIQMPGHTGLEVAKMLKKINPEINIIFTTGFSEYAVDAFNMRSSGYLLKPITKSDVKNELEHLRNPISASSQSPIRVKTFGFFDVFVQNRPITFKRERAKEVLAYLINKEGSTITRKELAGAVFEDREYSRNTQAYLTQVISSLKNSLEEAGIENLLIIDHNSYAVDTTKFSCDAYDYLKGDPDSLNSFHGEYMSQYSWAESEIFKFYE